MTTLIESRSRCLFRREIEKAGDRLQAVACDYAEVDAASQRGAAFGAEFPGEADAIVMRVNVARPAESQSGELLLNALNHGVNSAAPFAAHQRIEIGRIFSPCPRDQVAAALGVGFVPDGDIAINQFGK